MKGHAKNRARRNATKTEDLPTLPPITVRIPVAVKLTGMSRSRIYELIRDKKIAIAKDGTSTLVLFDSLKSFIDTLRVSA